ncbi:MAG: hypothetical protein KF708_06125 [Pirellulales bacterium]|nr:hypothetical protein [Pirellulales bacterium]
MWNSLHRLFRSPSSRPARGSSAPRSARRKGLTRATAQLESLEHRRLLALAPVQFDQVLDIETVGDQFYFSAAYESQQGAPGTVGVELWVSDGTTAGTRLVKDIRPGPANSSPQQLTNVNGTLFFIARTDEHGLELWKSDGTTSGTVLVKDISSGPNSSAPSDLSNVNGMLYFRTQLEGNTTTIHRSDGTEAGTVLLAVIPKLSPSSEVVSGGFTEVNGLAFFRGDDGTNGMELWKSDGTPGGTSIVKNIGPGINRGVNNHGINVGGTLFFTADDGTGFRLWMSDGTPAGTVKLGTTSPHDLTNLNGLLYFGAFEAGLGNELWKSDGTQAGTVLVGDITPGSSSSAPDGLTTIGNTLYLKAENRLWWSDGSPAGTNRISNNVQPTFNTLAADETPFVGANGLVFFPGRPPGSLPNVPTVLWKTDGTNAGTAPVSQIADIPHRLRSFDNSVYFVAQSERVLMRTDGSTAIRVLGLDPQDTNGVNLSPFPYFDSFDRPDSSRLAGPWLEQVGDLRMANNVVELAQNTESVATLFGLSKTDMLVRVDYDLSGGIEGQSVGVLARYGGPGDANTYMARVIRGPNNTYSANIWLNLNGNYTPLASAATSAAVGTLRFEVLGNRLSLFIDDVLITSVTDNSIAGPGSAGIRLTGGTANNFLVDEPLFTPPANVTLPFTDNFNRANNPNLGADWTEQLGDLRILNNALVQQFNSTAVLTLNGPDVSNVTISADIDLTTLAQTGSSIGLLGRYSGPGDSNGYMARLYRSNASQYFVQIWRHTGLDWEFLNQNSVASGVGNLRFVLNGTSLQAFWNNVLTVSVIDSAITGPGLIGIRHSGGVLDNFSAQ